MSELIDVTGRLRKMPAEAGNPVAYSIAVGDTRIPLNDLIGRPLRLDFDGVIRCIHCDRKTNKSFNQGFCYPCFRKLAACDSCIMSPEKCHYHLGTCREPEWGETHCMVEHVVYLANSSGLKVGITRGSQVPTRWIDQGAVDAIPMVRVATRYIAGLVEVACKAHVADRTNWRAMLKGDVPELDLAQERQRMLGLIADDLEALRQTHGQDSIREVDEQGLGLSYPVKVWPEKIKTHNLDKTPEVEGVLEGIKGQYLILDTGVINIRKFTGYEVRFRVMEG
ncbi:MAG: hypothetical protein COB05_11540 [Marinobacter sp.]|uniref:DUF2797 domain-containing protein n=1 Tax=Marinobacter adhaerens TaxID=1033846 RepID=A0A352IVZ0_9GAMM|nr:hypothetical protein [Marinobacter sp.]MCP4062022.1 DUF2797 domain-containing protein [Gammaproteobacteria bacterium]MTI77992.1 DUF2797 domain-containing protein [Marinobacter sp.]PHS46730.1 MAG: hypothetical protein COB05_11540 [Marinobacter sp.]HBC35623.1 DUF2797 domain-containing protein [Marinobacter adhaerens]